MQKHFVQAHDAVAVDEVKRPKRAGKTEVARKFERSAELRDAYAKSISRETKNFADRIAKLEEAHAVQAAAEKAELNSLRMSVNKLWKNWLDEHKVPEAHAIRPEAKAPEKAEPDQRSLDERAETARQQVTKESTPPEPDREIAPGWDDPSHAPYEPPDVEFER